MNRHRLELYGLTECLKVIAGILAGILVLLLVLYLAFLWFCFLPFRLAYKLHAPRSEGVKRTELEALAALAVSGFALLRSGNAPMTKREWERKRRKLMAQRPDDSIPF